MKIIFGLGNPGIEYKNTRHNLGYMVVENCVKKYKNLKFLNYDKFFADIARLKKEKEVIFFVKPKTFMNNCGISLNAITNYYSVDVADILVVCDDIDLPFGKIRFRQKGSSGGHRGLLSIINTMKTDNISRLRIGIGRPSNKNEVSEYVLSEFNNEEKKQLPSIIEKAVGICLDWVNFGPKYIITNYN